MALKLLQPSLRPLGQFDLADASHADMTGGECVSLTESAASSSELQAKDVGQSGPFGATNPLRFALGEYERGKLCGLADEGSASGYGTQFGHLIGSSAGQAVAVPLNTGIASGTGAVVIGPGTMKGSGKVTVWHAPGLYAVNAGPLAASGDMPADLVLNHDGTTGTDATTDSLGAAVDAVIDSATAINSAIFATEGGKLFAPASVPASASNFFMNGGLVGGATRSDQLGVYCGYMKDSSLVSTPAYLAGPSGELGSVYASDAEEFVLYFYGNQPLV